MSEYDKLPPNDLLPVEYIRQGETHEGEKRVASEFGKWLAALRDCRLAEKAGQLWHIYKSGKLTGPDKALIVGALLYCITPIDLAPDLIPVIGYVDDLLVVLGVLSYVEWKAR